MGILAMDWFGPGVLPFVAISGLVVLLGSIYGWSFEAA
jgi:hypothetical protein